MDNLVPVHVGLMGHIDHGKTALAKALSEKVSTAGLDRHPQAQTRGITIDLGFTMFELGNYLVTLVDAPGHADLIRSVVAGANIIDSAILVVAADEGPMVQTGEHVVVLQSMGVASIVVALTKTDIVNESQLVETEQKIRSILADTGFSEAPIIRVSAHSAQGIDELKDALRDTIQPRARTPEGPLIIPIDHAFPVKGHGTVVTGTILQGTVKVEESVEVAPLSKTSRVRSIQTFGEEREIASAGDRVGINIPDIDDSDITRGDYLGTPGSVTTSSGFIMKMQTNPLYQGRITKRMVVSASVGMPSVTAQIIPLSEDGIVLEEATNTSFHAAILLQKPVALRMDTRVLLHRTDLSPTQMRIIGAGEVVDIPKKVTLLRPRVRVGKVHRIREKDTLVEGLASNKEIAEHLVNAQVRCKNGVVGIIRQPFGTRGVVIVDFEDSVTETEEVYYQRLTEEEYSFG
ncbi:MAG: selenocysteine-specific translation elongation factor [Candidatus Thorarchaeota archaeon]|jgi:selenocysteine-specific elongation factor